jgi:hypothetical protein
MKRSTGNVTNGTFLDRWVVRQRVGEDGNVASRVEIAVATPVAPADPVEAADALLRTALREGAGHVEVDVAGVHVLAKKPPSVPPPPLAPTPAVASRPPKRSFTKSVAGRTAMPIPIYGDKKAPLFFADFLESVMEGIGDACFEYLRQGTSLARKSGKLRGAIAEEAVKRFYATDLGLHVQDAETGDRVNGIMRGKGLERYDFGYATGDGHVRRVEVKNARLKYQPSMQMWSLQFANVKSTEHEELVLVFECFDALRVYRWKGMNGSTSGVRTEATGGKIEIYASYNQPDPVAAHAQLIAKLGERNELLKVISYADPAYSDLWQMTTKTSEIYDNVPMGALSSPARAAMLENIVRSIMARDHDVSDAPISNSVNGSRRGKCRTECDFIVDKLRAEVKSCQMIWDKHNKGYKLHFESIKPALHDRLLLCWQTPTSLHIFEHDGVSGFSTNGKSTSSSGSQIQMYAPSGRSGYTVASAAERFLLKQFKYWGAKNRYVAHIRFADGDADRVLDLGMAIGGAGVDDGEEGEESGVGESEAADGEAGEEDGVSEGESEAGEESDEEEGGASEGESEDE